MAKTQDEVQKDAYPDAIANQNKYPYGLCLYLCEDELEKLGLDDCDLEPGDILHLHAFAQVTSHSKTMGADGEPHCRVELQLTHMSFEDEGEEDEEDDKEEPRPYF